MDWIIGIQNAINYIEDHITEELDYEQIAKESEARAKEEYEAIINQSKQECADLLNEKGASADKTGEYIFGRIVNGNC